MSNWFETGYDGVEREKFEREKRREMPWRFFLKTGQSAEVIFLDDFTRTRAVELPGSGEVINQPTVPFCFNEHNLTVDGDWRNFFTCLQKIDPPCTICSNGHYKYYIGMYTVVTSWKADDGTVRWSKKLFPAKINAIERIRSKQARLMETGKIKDGQLQYVQFHVSRNSEQSLVTGDDYEFVRVLTAEQVQELLPKPEQGQEPISIAPFNYSKLFAPKPKEELEKLFKQGRVQPPRKRGSTSASASSNTGSPTVGASTSDVGGATESGGNAADSIDF